MARKKKLTIDEITKELVMLDRVTNSLNTAVIALAYVMKVKGDELNKVNSKKYVKFVTEHVHPLVIRADEIVKEAAEESKKAAEKAKKEIK